VIGSGDSAVGRSPLSPSRVNIDCFAKGKSGNNDYLEGSGLFSLSTSSSSNLTSSLITTFNVDKIRTRKPVEVMS
jgi:hypothetical protein